MKICFICGILSEEFHNVPDVKAKYSGKNLREVIEIISGFCIDPPDFICYPCTDKVNEYDEYAAKAEKIQNDLRSLLQNKIFIKSEPKDEFDNDSITSCETELNTDNELDVIVPQMEFASSNVSAHFDWNSFKDNDELQCRTYSVSFIPEAPYEEVKSVKKSQKRPRATGEVFQCTHGSCGRRFPTQTRLMNHMQLHSKERPYQCSFCGKFYKTKDCLRSHQRVVHKNADKRVICDACGLVFTRKPSLERHFKSSHLKLRLYTCQLCGASYCNASSLQAHSFVHDRDNKNFECEVCKSKFHTKSKLNRHMRCHGEKQFECEICHRRYSQRYNLTAHMKQAHDQRLKTKLQERLSNPLIVCHLCGKVFDSSITLQAHMNEIHERLQLSV